MKHFLYDVLQFVFFLIAMTTIGLVFIGYAFYTLLYYLFTRWDDNTR